MNAGFFLLDSICSRSRFCGRGYHKCPQPGSSRACGRWRPQPRGPFTPVAKRTW